MDHDLRADFPADDGLERLLGAVRDDLRVDPPVPLEDAEHDRLAPGAPPALAPDAARAEVALVDLDLPVERALVGDPLRDEFAELVVVERGGVAVDAEEVSSGAGRGAGDEVLDEAELGVSGEAAAAALGHGG